MRWLCRPSKFPFLAIVGSITAYIIHQISKKGNFILKWFLDQLYLPSKISFFGNCRSHDCLYKPSKLPKRKFYSKIVFEILIPAIKIAFFGNCGSIITYISHQKFPKKEIPFLEGQCQPHIKLFPFFGLCVYISFLGISFFGKSLLAPY